MKILLSPITSNTNRRPISARLFRKVLRLLHESRATSHVPSSATCWNRFDYPVIANSIRTVDMLG